MATITRKNAWNNNGTFDNPDLLWYAKGVQAMQARQISDPTSWWFYAAIHGEYVAPGELQGGYPDWVNIPPPPNVPTTPLPSQDLIDKYWDQCQHGTWFFPPWHRGYLYSIENILRGIIQGLGGPSDWAIPYWNYFGGGNEYKMPPAFSQLTLPDGTPNPLYVNARYGPNNDRNIYIPFSNGINQNCQGDTIFTGVQPKHYGGAITGFAHSNRGPGGLENNPHNPVHVAIGGQDVSNGNYGLMADPGTAALDPIFYLHHSNIDRMWASWNAAGNLNSTDLNWLNGPTATGDRKFFMPKPDGTAWQYTPAMVNSISQLDYTYDDLSLGVTPPLVSKNNQRLRNLAVNLDNAKNVTSMDTNPQTDLVGANNESLTLNPAGVRTNVNLDSSGWNTVTNSLKNASTNSLPDEVILQLDDVRGNADSTVCSVSVNQQYVGHISFFGLRKASIKDSHHAGAGLTIRLDITKIIDNLFVNSGIDIKSLDVLIQPTNAILKNSNVTIGRVSVYRIGQK